MSTLCAHLVVLVYVLLLLVCTISLPTAPIRAHVVAVPHPHRVWIRHKKEYVVLVSKSMYIQIKSQKIKFPLEEKRTYVHAHARLRSVSHYIRAPLHKCWVTTD
jgi:hypothetical protein